MPLGRVVVIDVVGLKPEYFDLKEAAPNLAALKERGRLHRMKPVFPALTLPVQASLTTGAYPGEHGVVANGFFFPEDYRIAFWEQAASLVQARRVWRRLRGKEPGLSTALLFFQNSLYADCEVVMTPRPIHSEEGLIQWCYSKPVDLYEAVCGRIGPFELLHYWGPLAGIESSRWIAKAAVDIMDRVRPNLMFIYLPHLDYGLQKFGPGDFRIVDELRAVDAEVGRILSGIEGTEIEGETHILVVSEYAFSEVQGAVPLNRFFRNEGLLRARTIQGREYLDLELSPAFAMVDHQVAHIYVKPDRETEVRRVLERVEGVDFILGRDGKKTYRVDHPRAGDLVAVSARDRWFSYPWWDDPAKEPDYAGHIDIHRKPGYDPLELFFEEGTFRISQDTRLIRGSHGYPPRTADDDAVFVVVGEKADDLQIAEDFDITHVARIIEKLLT